MAEVAFETDRTILGNPDQTDWWSHSHVLVPYFAMYLGFPWWVVMGLTHIGEGIEALPILNANSRDDAAIVDPCQAAFGIIAFKVFEYLRICEVTFPYPKNSVLQLNMTWFKWIMTASVGCFPLILAVVLTATFGFHHDWIFTIAVSITAFLCWWYNQNCGKWRSYIQLAYPVGFSAAVVVANRFPYNPWLLSIWTHIPFIAMGIAIIIYKWRLALVAERNDDNGKFEGSTRLKNISTSDTESTQKSIDIV